MSKTLVIPLDEELADANWILWLVICVDMEGGKLDERHLEKIVGKVKLYDHDDDVTDEAPGFKAAVIKAFTDAGYTVVFADFGKLAWPGV